MVQRLQGYGREEIVPLGAILYTLGDRNTDMFVVLDGGVDVLLPSLNALLRSSLAIKSMILAESSASSTPSELCLAKIQSDREIE